MTEVSMTFRLRSGNYGEVTVTVEDKSLLTKEDLLALLRGEIEGIEAELNRRESLKAPELECDNCGADGNIGDGYGGYSSVECPECGNGWVVG